MRRRSQCALRRRDAAQAREGLTPQQHEGGARSRWHTHPLLTTKAPSLIPSRQPVAATSMPQHSMASTPWQGGKAGKGG